MMSEARELHAKRLHEALGMAAALKELSAGTHEGSFRAWRDRAQQSLNTLYGKEHDYSKRFGFLSFQDMRFRYGDEPQWDAEDQRRFVEDLVLAEQILADAVEEFPITTSPVEAAQRARGEQAGGPSITVNIHNVLSQTVSVQLSQIDGELDKAPLSNEMRKQAKALANELHSEAQGQQRWEVIGKLISALKALGKPVYEGVVVPIVLDLLKRQSGL